MTSSSDVHTVRFYPVGNGDSSQVILAGGKRLLFDYHHLASSEEDGVEIDLAKQLRDELKAAKKKSFDVVAFTHGDLDHIRGSTDFFVLEHSTTYQGGERIPIDELWVPAAMLLEECEKDQLKNEVYIWRREARYRLKQGKGIRIFSKPEKLKNWCKQNDVDFDKRKHLITDAGKTVPGFSTEADGVEFFCHSPFVKHVDEGDDLRNSCSLIFNVRFDVAGTITDYLAIGDSEWAILEDIVATTDAHGNMDRLKWNLFNIPHHCSYLALNREKGDTETVPAEGVQKLLRQGQPNAYVVSSSRPIRDSKAGREQVLPPHIQAKKAYEKYLAEVGGARFLTTMEEPSEKAPEPIDFQISFFGLKLVTKTRSAVVSVVSSPAPRAGR